MRAKNELLTDFVTVRFRNKDLHKLWAAACQDDRSVAAFCRRAVLEKLPPEENKKEVMSLLR